MLLVGDVLEEPVGWVLDRVDWLLVGDVLEEPVDWPVLVELDEDLDDPVVWALEWVERALEDFFEELVEDE